MKTPPTYWKVKASPIVLEWAKEVHGIWQRWNWIVSDQNGTHGFDYFPPKDLPELHQAQFKKHFYDPWKAGQTKKAFAVQREIGEPVSPYVPTTTTNVHQQPKVIGGSKQQIIVTPADGMDAEVWQDGETIKARSVPKRTRTNPKRITLAKHNRITAELQRQCEQLQAELHQMQESRERMYNVAKSKGAYNKELSDKMQSVQKERDDYRAAYVDETQKTIKLQGKIEELEQRKKDWEQVLNARIAQLEADRDQQHSIIVNKEAYIKRLEDDRQRLGTDLHTAEDHISKLHIAHLREINELSKQRDGIGVILIIVGIIAFGLAIAMLNGGAA